MTRKQIQLRVLLALLVALPFLFMIPGVWGYVAALLILIRVFAGDLMDIARWVDKEF